MLRILNPSAISKCAMLENEKIVAFCLHHSAIDIVMPRRKSLLNLQRSGAFIAAFTSEKLKMTIKKSSFRNWQLILKFSIGHFPVLIRYKTKSEVGTLCLTKSTRWRYNFKGLSEDGGLAEFSKKTPGLPL
jgi:hypothetical protein